MTKFTSHSNFRIASIFIALLLLLDSSAQALSSGGHQRSQSFSDCNWLVTYRGRTYDLMPITKQSLARPLDDDIREVMERYPESKQHLDLMVKYSHASKVHTWLASGSLAGALISAILRSRAKNSEGRQNGTFAIFTFGLFAAKGMQESWKATDSAKEELVRAVDAFNEVSPHKIDPAGANHENL